MIFYIAHAWQAMGTSIYWSSHAMQGLESTAVAFPFGQMGAVMPMAIALALFANISLSFAQPQAPAQAKGDALLCRSGNFASFSHSVHVMLHCVQVMFAPLVAQT